MEFKEYLLTENKQYLADKINDVLTSLLEIIQGGDQISARQLIRHSEEVVNQIRRILHSSWQRSLFKHLRKLQKCGVAIMKAIDEKGDLDEILNSCRSEVEEILGKLGKPVNSLGTSNKKPKEEQPQPEVPQPPMQPPQQGNQMQASQDQMQQQQGIPEM